MKTLLIADDQAPLRRLVGATLASNEYRVLEAADGDEAWEIIRRERPDVVLLDIMMPGRNGLELTRAIRADPELAATKLILLTAFADPRDIRAGLDAGADRYLTKPFSPRQLVAVVREALGLPS